jgi:hypothetical protein
MTVVMQHQFWDLTVTESAFEVGLSFKGVPEKLFIPFRAITGFVDPHASFGLKFDPPPETALIAASSPSQAPALPIEDKRKEKAGPQEPAAKPAEAGNAAVVSLDAFRKKNG